jgi:hypothetical protein
MNTDKTISSVILSGAKDPRESTDVCRGLGFFALLRMTEAGDGLVFIRDIRVIRG